MHRWKTTTSTIPSAPHVLITRKHVIHFRLCELFSILDMEIGTKLATTADPAQMKDTNGFLLLVWNLFRVLLHPVKIRTLAGLFIAGTNPQ